jgi:hypothetical protein
MFLKRILRQDGGSNSAEAQRFEFCDHTLYQPDVEFLPKGANLSPGSGEVLPFAAFGQTISGTGN